MKLKENCKLLSLDDKAVIPIGDPHRPLSIGVCGHNACLTQNQETSLLALDHDFHICLIPSVLPKGDVPNNVTDSLFDGKGSVTLKDKITSAASCCRSYINSSEDLL